MNFALAGIGRWGQVCIKTLGQMEGSKLVATYSRHLESYDNLPNELKVCPHYINFDEILHNPKVDAIIVATPPDTHYDLSSKALQYGKHVFCEKPCMFTKEQFSIIEGQVNPCVFFTDYTNLYHSVISEMENMVEESDGKLKLTLINSGSKGTYSDLWDYGSHVISIICHLFPDCMFYDMAHGINPLGNHTLKFNTKWLDFSAEFGNHSISRQHFFFLNNGRRTVMWRNNGKENPLKIALEKFAAGVLVSNIELSRKIKSILSRYEHE